MNKEKELLLALLVEKYTTKEPLTYSVTAPKKAKKSYRRRTGKRHTWTPSEKLALIRQRESGRSWSEISFDLGLPIKSVESMHYGLTSRKSVSQ